MKNRTGDKLISIHTHDMLTKTLHAEYRETIKTMQAEHRETILALVREYRKL